MNITLTLIGQTLAFFLFIWFCSVFVWPALITVMAEREKKIESGLLAAERAQKDLALAKKNAAQKLHEAKEQATDIIDAAHKRSQQIIDEAKEQAQAEANRLIAAGRAEVEQQASRTKEELRSEVTGLALAIAEKVLASSVDASTNQDIVDKLVAELYKD